MTLTTPFASGLLVAALLSPVGQEPAPAPADEPTAPLEVDLGPDVPKLRIPRGEELVFEVEVSALLIEATLGEVRMESGVEPYRTSLLLPGGGGDSGKETGWLRASARGTHQLYKMEALIESRFLPQAWPRVVYRYDHRGSEVRKRELLIGQKEGERGGVRPRASYRSDTDRGAPKGTRIWGETRSRRLPSEWTLETIGAVYMMRGLVLDDVEEFTFPLLTKLKLWNVTVKRGKTAVIDTPAGSFDAVQLVLETERHPEEEGVSPEEFEGLFGIHGTITVWACAKTGVPLRVMGEVPAGPIDIECDIRLKSFSGTPAEFAPREKKE